MSMIRLTDEQCERIRYHFPEENSANGRHGRKPTPTRCALEGVLWIRSHYGIHANAVIDLSAFPTTTFLYRCLDCIEEALPTLKSVPAGEMSV
jgi:hypothetical protein